jgi:hypothetical protein
MSGYLFSVVTGCTRGIGRAYVDELARRKMDIILVKHFIQLFSSIIESKKLGLFSIW